MWGGSSTVCSPSVLERVLGPFLNGVTAHKAAMNVHHHLGGPSFQYLGYTPKSAVAAGRGEHTFNFIRNWCLISREQRHFAFHPALPERPRWHTLSGLSLVLVLVCCSDAVWGTDHGGFDDVKD